ncbi:MAG: hypothetical protein ACLR2G_06775 [Phascolarctobacterium faecium]
MCRRNYRCRYGEIDVLPLRQRA